MSLASLFDRERSRLWLKLGAVAEKHSALRSLLSREGDDRVGYLVESAAYGIARMREVLSDDCPQETHAIIGTSMPEFLRPTPAMTVAQWTPGDVARTGAASLSENQQLRSIAVEGGPCQFQTLWPVVASPLTISQTSVERRGPGSQALRLRFAIDPGVSAGEAFPSSLRIFASGKDPLNTLDIVHALSTGTSFAVRVLGEHGEVLESHEHANVRVAASILSDHTPLLPGRRDGFASHSLLRVYFAFPEAFCFFQLEGLSALLANSPEHAKAVELLIGLERPLGDHAAAVAFHLHCAPCANIRPATYAPIHFGSAFTRQKIVPQNLVGTELFEIESLQIRAAEGGANSMALPMWHEDDGNVLLPGDLVGRMHRRAGPRGGATECDLELVALGGRSLATDCAVTVHATVTDGSRAERLLPGDIGHEGDESSWVNITRVTPPIPVALDRQVPWRANAYARITAADFATPRAIRGFLDLLDVTGRRARSAGSSQGLGVESVSRKSFDRIVKDEVHGGEAVNVVLHPDAFGGVGATWLLGELLARAFAERTDVLRFSHLRWVTRDGAVRADYGARQGERLPFPFG